MSRIPRLRRTKSLIDFDDDESDQYSNKNEELPFAMAVPDPLNHPAYMQMDHQYTTHRPEYDQDRFIANKSSNDSSSSNDEDIHNHTQSPLNQTAMIEDNADHSPNVTAMNSHTTTTNTHDDDTTRAHITAINAQNTATNTRNTDTNAHTTDTNAHTTDINAHTTDTNAHTTDTNAHTTATNTHEAATHAHITAINTQNNTTNTQNTATSTQSTATSTQNTATSTQSTATNTHITATSTNITATHATSTQDAAAAFDSTATNSFTTATNAHDATINAHDAATNNQITTTHTHIDEDSSKDMIEICNNDTSLVDSDETELNITSDIDHVVPKVAYYSNDSTSSGVVSTANTEKLFDSGDYFPTSKMMNFDDVDDAQDSITRKNTLFNLGIKRIPSDGIPSDGIPSDSIPSDSIPSDGIPDDEALPARKSVVHFNRTNSGNDVLQIFSVKPVFNTDNVGTFINEEYTPDPVDPNAPEPTREELFYENEFSILCTPTDDNEKPETTVSAEEKNPDQIEFYDKFWDDIEGVAVEDTQNRTTSDTNKEQANVSEESIAQSVKLLTQPEGQVVSSEVQVNTPIPSSSPNNSSSRRTRPRRNVKNINYNEDVQINQVINSTTDSAAEDASVTTMNEATPDIILPQPTEKTAKGRGRPVKAKNINATASTIQKSTAIKTATTTTTKKRLRSKDAPADKNEVVDHPTTLPLTRQNKQRKVNASASVVTSEVDITGDLIDQDSTAQDHKEVNYEEPLNTTSSRKITYPKKKVGARATKEDSSKSSDKESIGSKKRRAPAKSSNKEVSDDKEGTPSKTRRSARGKVPVKQVEDVIEEDPIATEVQQTEITTPPKRKYAKRKGKGKEVESSNILSGQSNPSNTDGSSLQDIAYLLQDRNSFLTDESIKDKIQDWVLNLTNEEKKELAKLLPKPDLDNGEWNDDLAFLEGPHFWEALDKWQEILFLGGFETTYDGKEETPDSTFKDDNYEEYWGQKMK